MKNKIGITFEQLGGILNAFDESTEDLEVSVKKVKEALELPFTTNEDENIKFRTLIELAALKQLAYDNDLDCVISHIEEQVKKVMNVEKPYTGPVPDEVRPITIRAGSPSAKLLIWHNTEITPPPLGHQVIGFDFNAENRSDFSVFIAKRELDNWYWLENGDWGVLGKRFYPDVWAYRPEKN